MTRADTIFKNLEQFIKHISRLRKKRRGSVIEIRKTREPRKSPNHISRESILEKTDGRCHVCGGLIAPDDKWQADHIFAYAHGGNDSLANYLAAHTYCNNYRRSFSAEEFQWVLKLGIWFRTQIEKKNYLALELADKFMKHEMRRDSRRRK